MDRQAAVIELEDSGGVTEVHAPPGRGVVEALEPVCPRMQERDAGGRTGARVRVEVLRQRQQLLTAMAQRDAEHGEVGREGRVQVVDVGAQPADAVALTRAAVETMGPAVRRAPRCMASMT